MRQTRIIGTGSARPPAEKELWGEPDILRCFE